MNSLIRIGRVVARQLVFSVDTIVGLIAFVLLSIYFAEPPRMGNLLLAIVFSHLPDIDFLPFLLFRKRFRLVSHWVVGHHPWLYFLVIGFFSSIVSVNEHSYFIIGLMFVCVLAHFIHDSVQPQGMYWMYPFEWSRFTFTDILPRPPYRWDIEESDKAKLETSKADSAGQFERRKENISSRQMIVWWFAVGMVASFYFL